jgi:hypothetical protein
VVATGITAVMPAEAVAVAGMVPAMVGRSAVVPPLSQIGQRRRDEGRPHFTEEGEARLGGTQPTGPGPRPAHRHRRISLEQPSNTP